MLYYLSWPVAKLLGFLFSRIYGKKHIQNTKFLKEACQGLIIASNHQSYIDIPILMSLFPVWAPIHFVAKKDLLKIPLLDFLFPLTFMIPVDREQTVSRQNFSFMRITLQLLKNAEIIGIFPEGGIGKGSAKRGIIALTKKTPTCILPIKLIIKPWFHIWDNIPIGSYTVVCGSLLTADDLEGDTDKEKVINLLEKIASLEPSVQEDA